MHRPEIKIERGMKILLNKPTLGVVGVSPLPVD
jgi:hypothetical protein